MNNHVLCKTLFPPPGRVCAQCEDLRHEGGVDQEEPVGGDRVVRRFPEEQHSAAEPLVQGAPEV